VVSHENVADVVGTVIYKVWRLECINWIISQSAMLRCTRPINVFTGRVDKISVVQNTEYTELSRFRVMRVEAKGESLISLRYRIFATRLILCFLSLHKQQGRLTLQGNEFARKGKWKESGSFLAKCGICKQREMQEKINLNLQGKEIATNEIWREMESVWNGICK